MQCTRMIIDSNQSCYSHAREMIKENVMHQNGQMRFYFPIPTTLVDSDNPRVKSAARQFMKFLYISKFCNKIDKQSSSLSGLISGHQMMNQSFAYEFVKDEVTRLSKSVNVLRLISLMLLKMLHIQKSIVKLDMLLCISATSGEISFFNELFKKYVMSFIGNTFLIFILKRNPLIFFGLHFIQDVGCKQIYQKVIGNAINIKYRFWTFELLEERKKKPRKVLLIRWFKSHRKKKFKNRFM